VADYDVVEEMTLRDYAAVVWRRKWLVILPMLLTGLVAAALTLAQTPMYRASADVLVRLPPTANSLGSTGAVMSPRLVENEFETASGSTLKSQVRTIVGAEPTLTVSSSEGSDVFTFTATSSNADNAAFAANTYAEQYIQLQQNSLIQQYDARVQVLEGQLAGIEEGTVDASRQSEYERELEDLAVSIDLARTSSSTLIDAATPPGAPYEPNLTRTVTLALVVGLLLGLGAAFLVDYLDTSIRDEDDLHAATGLPNLGTIPQVSLPAKATEGHIVTRDAPQSPPAEAYRALRTAIRFLSLDRPIHSLLVTSARPGEGKTTTATNLAVVASRSGQRVLLIDCDMRKPQAHLFFALPNEVGFTSVLLGEVTLQEAAQFPEGESKLAVVTSGPLPPDPSDLLSGDTTRRALDRIRSEVDLIVLDSPPVLPVADPTVLAGMVDGVIVVASAGTTDRRHLARAVGRLQQVDAPLLGTVLNRYDGNGEADYSYGYGRPVLPSEVADDEPAGRRRDERASEPTA
jgi:capsular exopolysaccharide synthesis family protein